MKRRTGGTWFLATAVLAGLLAAVLTVRAITGRETQVQVYVVMEEIQPYAPLTPDLFRLETMPARVVPSDAVVDLTVIDKRFARTLLLKGTVLREGHLALDQAEAAVTARLTEMGSPRSRALAINVDRETGVGGTVQAGDKVDVIVAVKVDTPQGTLPVAKVIARAVPVLYAQAPTDNGRKGFVVVEVTPEVAEEIAFAQMAGSVYLATNPYNADLDAANTAGVTPEKFLQKHQMQPGPAGSQAAPAGAGTGSPPPGESAAGAQGTP